jgi:hypothetical protein
MTDKSPRKRPSMPDRETRERQAQRRLGSENPACCHCGNSDWRTLELHHIAGQAFDDLTVILCKNCHAALSDAQSDHPPMVDDTPTKFDKIGRSLVNFADFSAQLARRHQEFGEFLIEFARSIVTK